MSQANSNEVQMLRRSICIAEKPQLSDRRHAKQSDPASEQATTEPQVAEPAMDEMAEDVAEADAPPEDTLREEAMETEMPLPSDSANSATPSTPSSTTTDMDERSAIEKQPYDFDRCSVQIAIQLLPDDGNTNGRMVVVGVRSHLDPPILRVTRWNELGTLPPLVIALLDELKAELPKREQAARGAIAKKQAELAQRKSIMTAKTARGKKDQAPLATAPAVSSDVTTPNHRLRPAVQVTTAPQQQQGLF